MQLIMVKGRTAHWMQHNKMEIYRTQKLVALCILTTRTVLFTLHTNDFHPGWCPAPGYKQNDQTLFEPSIIC